MYQIKGVVMLTLPVQTGEGQRGMWKKQEFVIETISNYPKKVKFVAWGDVLDKVELKNGLVVEVEFDLESREFNGRWYTDARARNIVAGNGSAPLQEDEPKVAEEDDLPF